MVCESIGVSGNPSASAGEEKDRGCGCVRGDSWGPVSIPPKMDWSSTSRRLERPLRWPSDITTKDMIRASKVAGMKEHTW